MTDSKAPRPDSPRVQPLVHLSHPDAHAPGYEYPEAAAMPLSGKAVLIGFVVALALAWAQFFLEHTFHEVGHASVAWPWMIPFAMLLGSIAIMPFVAKHWWEHHYAKVAIGLGVVVAAYYCFFKGEVGYGNMGKATAEYISFIFLLGSLFIVSGGIVIRVRGDATPMVNTILLLIGAVVANIFGTTGASMLLIRPFLRMNKKHLRMYHVVFFIFIVSNVGGSLTPIGDPPLFLGYLQGVPFFWVFEQCWPIWLLVNGMLLAVFFVIDSIHARKDDRAQDETVDEYGPTVSLYGATNLLFITVILVGVLGHSYINHFTEAKFGFHGPWREILMAIAAFGSLAATPKRVHGENVFNYAPIKEVAFLFIGIFLTMVPALNVLYNRAQSGELPLRTPGQYYFLSGTLSSVLDNAPTYLTFFQTQLGSLDSLAVQREIEIVKDPLHDLEGHLDGLNTTQVTQVRDAVAAMQKYQPQRFKDGSISEREIRVANLVGEPKLNDFLVAISMGAVMFGAMTYIGNGPNFMVKSIAEHQGAPVPSFFGYVFMFAIPILLPILVLVWFLFLRG
jgi:Na+/H+ antiporter NhaD/arsenite permease-like protein